MTPPRTAWAWVLLILVAAACSPGPAAPPRPETEPVAPAGAAHSIYVTSNGWHSGIVIARAGLVGRIPEAADFAQARYLEFGWGDAEYYPAKQTTLAMTLRAALAPTPAVVHVAGLSLTPARRYPKSEVVELSLDGAGLSRLVDFIALSFDRGGRERADPTGPGLYRDSRFYPARGRFHLLNTCNTWTARALAAAGLAVDATGTVRAEGLMAQVRRLARRP